MKSMTGFGKGISEENGRKITVELRSVNHRFLDLMLKLPRQLVFCEDSIRKIIAKYCVRGHIDVFCNYEDHRDNQETVKADIGLALQYKCIASELEKVGFTNDFTATQAMRCPDVVTTEASDDDDNAILDLVETATEEACKRLYEMRITEGERLKEDIKGKIVYLQTLTDEIEKRAPLVAENYAEKLRLRIEDSLKNIAIDEARLLNEIAFFVDKANIDEEITRLKGHLLHGLDILDEKEAIGKKMDFLVQEMNREVNTTGSKSNDLLLTEVVLKAKNEVEKIREQIQNIE